MTAISEVLTKAIQGQYRLNWNGIHGISHFVRVRVNGLRLAEVTGARRDVVDLFAFLHDSLRRNERFDPGHGNRASGFARPLQGQHFELDAEDLDLLCLACEFHTKGMLDGDVNVQTCWDSDRLDLGRVGTIPRAGKLSTAAAKDPEMIEWAYRRSIYRRGVRRGTSQPIMLNSVSHPVVWAVSSPLNAKPTRRESAYRPYSDCGEQS